MQIGEYAVMPANEREFVEFLEFNDFTYEPEYEKNPSGDERVVIVNVVKRFYFFASMFYFYPRIGEEEFYIKINHFPKDKISHESLFADDGKLLYEGYTFNGRPYGLGRLYFDNGNVYQDGVFDFKGIKLGKEYYPSGQLKFEGKWSITYGYGPNAPYKGNVYSEDGELTFTGKFQIVKGGVGWPMIKHPRGYRLIEKDSPEIEYVRDRPINWEMQEKMMKDIYTYSEQIQAYGLEDLYDERDELIREIREFEKDGQKSEDGEMAYLYKHLYLSEVCRMINEKGVIR